MKSRHHPSPTTASKYAHEAAEEETESRKRKASHDTNGRSGAESGESKKGRRDAGKRVQVKWTVPSTDGMDFGTVIKGYAKMSPAEKLKAKTRFLEKRYGAVAQLDRTSKQFSELADEEDNLLRSGTEDQAHSIFTHEDAIFGVLTKAPERAAEEKPSIDEQPTPDEDHLSSSAAPPDLISPEIVRSQKTTSWRERAAWLKQKRKESEMKDTK